MKYCLHVWLTTLSLTLVSFPLAAKDEPPELPFFLTLSPEEPTDGDDRVVVNHVIYETLACFAEGRFHLLISPPDFEKTTYSWGFINLAVTSSSTHTSASITPRSSIGSADDTDLPVWSGTLEYMEKAQHPFALLTPIVQRRETECTNTFVIRRHLERVHELWNLLAPSLEAKKKVRVTLNEQNFTLSYNPLYGLITAPELIDICHCCDFLLYFLIKWDAKIAVTAEALALTPL